MTPQMQQYWHQCQQQRMAVSAPRNQDLNFQTYLHAQLANWRPFVEIQQPTQLQLRHALGGLPLQQLQRIMDAKPNVGGDARPRELWQNQPDQFAQQMTSNAESTTLYHPQPEHLVQQPPSFFNDEIDYRPEEATLFNPDAPDNQQLLLQGSRAMDTLAFPYAGREQAVDNRHTHQSSSGPHGNNFDHGRIATYVDASQYQLVHSEDWHQASIDLDDEADSPASIDTYSSGPFTPVAADEDGGPFLSAGPRLNDELATSFNSKDSDFLDASRFGHSLSSASTNDEKATSAMHQTGFRLGSSHGIKYNGLPVVPHHVMPFDHYAAEPATDPSTALALSPVSHIPCTLPSNGAIIPATRHSQYGSITRVPRVEGRNNLLTEAAIRRQRDDYLLEMRERGLSYKEIRRRGKFREAESTLRGRIRVLTKDKSERVRKPEWTDMDVRLLKSAVTAHLKRKAAGDYAKMREGKVPWKRISAWIKDNGGSYLFAPATCARKWDEVEGS